MKMNDNMTDQVKIEIFSKTLQEVLANKDTSKIEKYFTKDITMIINETVLSGIDKVKARIDWIKQNIPAVQVTLEKIFFCGNKGFDHHTTAYTDSNGIEKKIQVFSYIEFRDDKICRFEGLSIELGGKPLLDAVSTT